MFAIVFIKEGMKTKIYLRKAVNLQQEMKVIKIFC